MFQTIASVSNVLSSLFGIFASIEELTDADNNNDIAAITAFTGGEPPRLPVTSQPRGPPTCLLACFHSVDEQSVDSAKLACSASEEFISAPHAQTTRLKEQHHLHMCTQKFCLALPLAVLSVGLVAAQRELLDLLTLGIRTRAEGMQQAITASAGGLANSAGG